MREDGVLVGIEGAYGNIPKIRPPLVFGKANADQLVAALDDARAAIRVGRFEQAIGQSRRRGSFSTHEKGNLLTRPRDSGRIGPRGLETQVTRRQAISVSSGLEIWVPR